MTVSSWPRRRRWVEGAVAGGGALDAADRDGFALDGRGGVDLEEVEEVVGADVAEAAGVEDGEDAVFADGFVESGDEVLFGDGSFAEELFHELVFAFGDELDQGFVRGLGFGLEAGGDFAGLCRGRRRRACRGRPPW